MQQNFDYSRLNFLTNNASEFAHAAETGAKLMFEISTLEFLSALSTEILKDKRSRQYPDVVSYAYWIRKSSLTEHLKQYVDCDKRMGRGVAFHIAPSNVPVNFAVSFTSALIAGNICVVRVSDKRFAQVDIIVDAVNRLFDSSFEDMKRYLYIIRYEHSDEITENLTNICDIRIIWGGNETISRIRKAQLPPRAIEMAFADRHSIAVIDSDDYLESDAEKIAADFYTDTYYTDQNACSSPRLVIWTGTAKKEARQRFWQHLCRLAEKKYEFQPILAVDKLNALCTLAALHGNVKGSSRDNVCKRVELERLSAEVPDYKMSGGYFFEYEAEDLTEILPVLGKSCQTVSYLGNLSEAIKNLVVSNGVRGADRIVPMGRTMELSFWWDGYDMIQAMTRYIYSDSFYK